MDAAPRTCFSRGLVAVVVVMLGFEAMRAFYPLSLFLLRDRFGGTSIHVGLFAFTLFCLVFPTVLASLGVSAQTALRASFAALVFFRLLGQLWWFDPVGNLALNCGVLLAFFIAVTSCLRLSLHWGRPLLLGLAFGVLGDTALHGALGTLDLTWRHTAPSTLLLLLYLGAARWAYSHACLTSHASHASHATHTTHSSKGRPDEAWRNAPSALAMIAVGPFLFLYLQQYGNLSRFAALLDGSYAAAYGWALAGQAVALTLTAHLLRYLPRLSALPTGLVWAALGCGLILAHADPWPTDATAVLALLCGQTAGLMLMGCVIASPPTKTEVRGEASWRRSVGAACALGFGLLLQVALVFAYYASYDLVLPMNPHHLAPLAASFLWLAGGFALMARRHGTPKVPALGAVGSLPSARVGLALLAGLALLPMLTAPGAPPPPAAPGDGTFTALTYNLHNGFDTQGHLGLERLAREIEASGADIVALQEVSRGWLVYGSVDMMSWLERRLGMSCVYGPTADPLWGNALFSRFPIESVSLESIPPDSLLLRRGLIRAEVQAGGPAPLQVIATHFHHAKGASQERQLQTDAVLSAAAKALATPELAGDQALGPVLLMGDFNAQPGSPEIEMLQDAGLHSALPYGTATFPADAPDQQIDYLWSNPALELQSSRLIGGTASDHLGVVAQYRVKLAEQ